MNLLYESITIDELRNNESYFDYFPSTYLYHGTSKSVYRNNIQFLNFRMREKSKDSIYFMHHAINKFSEKKFNLPIRNLLFVTQNSTIADDYGNTVIIVPKGKNYRLFANQHYTDITDELNLEPSPFISTNIRKVLWRIARSPHYFKNWNMVYDFMDNKVELRDTVMQFFYDEDSTIKSRIYDKTYDQDTTLEDFAAEITKYIGEIAISNNLSSAKADLYYPIYEYADDLYPIILDALNKEVDAIAKNYVDGVEEINSEAQLENEHTEIMLYAPDGFYMVSYN